MSLLGDLFGEEEEGQGTDKSSSSQKASVPVPSHPRLSHGLCGIYNQGATCYLNSLLQTLLMTPEFRESLFKLGANELGRLEEKDVPGAKVRVIPIQLQRLFARLLLLNQQGASTEELTDSFGWTSNEELQQHDVQELNRILFSAVEDSLVGTPGKGLIHTLYHGTIVNQIICQVCGRVSEREEDFLDLCITVAGNDGLADGLHGNFVETELMSDKNQYRCEKCGKLVDAKKGAKLRHLPPILSVSLLRFSFDYVKLERYKETGKFSFPVSLDMSPYCENVSTVGDTEYELFSVVIHRGSTHGGHYHAYIRDVDSLGRWTHPDAEEVLLPRDPATGKVDFLEFDSPIELLQAILQQGSQHGMRVDLLCAELVKQTGVSWNKRFKKNHGPINKFLKKYDDKFVLNQDVNWVSLKDYSQWATSKGNSTLQEIQNFDDIEAPKNEAGCERQASKRSQSPPPENGHCWFDFDDARIHPISSQQLEKQFSGRESAYMLFYRRISMRRPAEAVCDPCYGVPPYLISDVYEENDRLAKERSAYELKINSVHIQVHFARFYDFREGALQVTANNGMCPYIEMTLDRRKTVAELKVEIMELGGELVPDKFVIHCAKELPSGLHLMECISEDESTVIKGTPVTDESQLFVWGGKQVKGQTVPVGKECQPILLNVTYGNPHKLKHGFPKNTTMGELRHLLDKLTGIRADSMVLSGVLSKDGNTCLVKFGAEKNGATLEELKIEDMDHFVVEGSDSSNKKVAEVPAAEQCHMMSFVVENRCANLKDGTWPVTVVEVDKDAVHTVEALKAAVISQLGIKDIQDGGRLRLDDDDHGLQSAIHEQQSLISAGLNQGMRVVIEAGCAPQSNQMTVRYAIGNCSGDVPDEEVIVDRSITVQDCLCVMKEKAAITGDSWHLRKTNWCGELDELLDDMEASLEQFQVRDGDRLLLEEGQIPPKGYLKFTVWLLVSSHQVLPPSGDNGVMSWLTSGLQAKHSLWALYSSCILPRNHSRHKLSIFHSLMSGNSSTDNTSTCRGETVSMGEILINKEATLQDLKVQIMSLAHLQELRLPNPHYLRVRLWEDKQVTTILKGMSQTIQRLKLTSNSHLCVEVLKAEEDLNEKQLLLNIQMRVVETRKYLPRQELVWDISSRGATLQSLRYAVSTLLGLNMDNLKIAKHLPDKHEWIILKETNTNKQNKQAKGKKKGPTKVNLTHAPYHLRDGDVLGVKDLQYNPFNPEDFTTVEDDEGKERLKQEIEHKKKQREENRRRNASLNVGGEDSKKKREVGIKIHVENFK